jgi:hypothetical protein
VHLRAHLLQLMQPIHRGRFDKGLLARLAPPHGITIIEKEGARQ